MNKRLNQAAQGGFTLIELIVVIVVLGILAATALPKFASMGGDARAATLRAAAGSLGSIAATVHGKYLVDTSKTEFTLEGQKVTLASGYPKADSDTAAAAGLNTTNDYTVVVGAATLDADKNWPTLVAGEMAIIPKSIASAGLGSKCYVKYTEASTANDGKVTPPSVTIPNTLVADNCQ